MTETKLLTFELKPGAAELEIHCNQEGLEFLVQALQSLAASNAPMPRHDHLMTPSWAGNELSEVLQRDENTLLNHVTVKLWDEPPYSSD